MTEQTFKQEMFGDLKNYHQLEYYKNQVELIKKDKLASFDGKKYCTVNGLDDAIVGYGDAMLDLHYYERLMDI